MKQGKTTVRKVGDKTYEIQTESTLSDEYVGDTYNDLSFDLFYNTVRIKKGIIDKL